MTSNRITIFTTPPPLYHAWSRVWTYKYSGEILVSTTMCWSSERNENKPGHISRQFFTPQDQYTGGENWLFLTFLGLKFFFFTSKFDFFTSHSWRANTFIKSTLYKSEFCRKAAVNCWEFFNPKKFILFFTIDSRIPWRHMAPTSNLTSYS